MTTQTTQNTPNIPSSKVRLATVWLDGCSGCHMSFLDMDERLIELASKIDLVYSPIVDIKEFPEGVDVTLVEGAISSDEDLHKICQIRARTKLLISLGDCAVTANVPSLRNPFGANAILHHLYQDEIPDQVVPLLLKNARPVHAVVKVDAFVPGCPPSADIIWYAINELLAGRLPDLGNKTHFGA